MDWVELLLDWLPLVVYVLVLYYQYRLAKSLAEKNHRLWEGFDTMYKAFWQVVHMVEPSKRLELMEEVTANLEKVGKMEKKGYDSIRK